MLISLLVLDSEEQQQVMGNAYGLKIFLYIALHLKQRTRYLLLEDTVCSAMRELLHLYTLRRRAFTGCFYCRYSPYARPSKAMKLLAEKVGRVLGREVTIRITIKHVVAPSPIELWRFIPRNIDYMYASDSEP